MSDSIQDIIKNVKNLTNYEIEQKLDHLVYSDYHFSNLNEANKNLVLNLIKEYKNLIIAGHPVTRVKVRDDMYNLYENRIKLGLSSVDLEQIKNIAESFKTD